MAIASGLFPFTLGKVEHQFGLLSVQDLINISNTLNTSEVMDINALDRYTRHPLGCEVFLLTAGKKANPNLTIEEVKKMGSILRRTQVANEIFIKSVISGEEVEPE